MIYRFGLFELDTGQFELRRNGALQKLEPQVFDVLAFLIENHDRLVTKDELMERVWGDKFISEAALNSRLMAARRAIGDNGRDQRLIRTQHGRGYRFVGFLEAPYLEASTETRDAAPVPSPVLISAPMEHTESFGRDAELVQLDAWMQLASSGRRQFAFVTGEAGIGKTTLLRTFAEAASVAGAMIATGQCLEQRGGGEAYLPVFDALARIAREEATIATLIFRTAPSWAAHLPEIYTPDEQLQAQQRSLGNNSERMLREIMAVFEAVSHDRALILIFEDLHWSDDATLDMISGLARRPESAQLMVLGSYRPGDVAIDSSLGRIKQELVARSLCRELSLGPISLAASEQIVARRLGGSARIEEGLVAALHERADGNPLYLTALLEYAATDSGQENLRAAGDLDSRLPPNLEQVIAQQFDRQAPDDRALLLCASVAGPEFTTVELAAALDDSIEAVELRCDALARGGNFIVGGKSTSDWPDGSVGMKYAFGHSLFQAVLYQRLTASQKQRIHQDVAERLELAFGSQATAHATELAQHFALGRDASRAVLYFEHAAEQAKSRGAYREAASHLTHALEIVQAREVFPARDAREMTLRAKLGSALLVTHGFGHDAVLNEFTRALELADQLGESTAIGNVVLNLAALLEYRSQHAQAEGVLLRLQSSETEFQLPFHALLSCSYFHQGAFKESAEQGSRGLAIADATQIDPRFASLGEDPANGCSEWSAEALWFLGYPDQALRTIDNAVELSKRPGHHYTLASTQSHAARIHQLRREPLRVLRHAADTVTLAADQGYAYHHAVALVLAGWASAMVGNTSSGVDQIRAGIQAHRDTGAGMDRPYFLALLAEALAAHGNLTGAREVIESAIASVPDDSQFFYGAELHRLRGVILASFDESLVPEAEASFRKALIVAEGQGALSLHLRAASSLAGLLFDQGGNDETRPILEAAYSQFSEGFDTPDLIEASRLLTVL